MPNKRRNGIEFRINGNASPLNFLMAGVSNYVWRPQGILTLSADDIIPVEIKIRSKRKAA
jgi:hypothetical protein